MKDVLERELEYCQDCRYCQWEEPAYTSWDCRFDLHPEWDEENECLNCQKYKMANWEEYE